MIDRQTIIQIDRQIEKKKIKDYIVTNTNFVFYFSKLKVLIFLFFLNLYSIIKSVKCIICKTTYNKYIHTYDNTVLQQWTIEELPLLEIFKNHSTIFNLSLPNMVRNWQKVSTLTLMNHSIQSKNDWVGAINTEVRLMRSIAKSLSSSFLTTH